MNALYLLLNRRNTTAATATDRLSINDAPLSEIRPGAFARWIASIEKSEAQAIRSQSATTEGIAVTHVGGAPEPG